MFSVGVTTNEGLAEIIQSRWFKPLIRSKKAQICHVTAGKVTSIVMYVKLTLVKRISLIGLGLGLVLGLGLELGLGLGLGLELGLGLVLGLGLELGLGLGLELGLRLGLGVSLSNPSA